MLQIIGWIGCFYLVIKGIEFIGSNSFRTPDGQITKTASTAALLCFAGAAGFFFVLQYQVSSSRPTLSDLTRTGSSFENLENVEDTLSMDADATNAADDALAAAQRAVENADHAVESAKGAVEDARN